MTQEAAGKDSLRGALVGVGDRWEAWKLGWQRDSDPSTTGEWREGAHWGLEGGVLPLILNLVGLGVEKTSGWLELWGWHFGAVKIRRFGSLRKGYSWSRERKELLKDVAFAWDLEVWRMGTGFFKVWVFGYI